MKIKIFVFALMAVVLFACNVEANSTSEPAIEPTIEPTSLPTAVPTPVPNTFYVDPSISLGEISPYAFGTNYGPWVALRFEMLSAAEEAGITLIRWPGGEWGDQNDIKNYQVDQIVSFANQLGAELNIHVRLRNGTPEQAAELVRYSNIEKQYGVRFWTIGNEPTLYDGFIDTTYNLEIFNREWREFAEAMLAVDPTIQLIGPEVHQYSDIVNGAVRESAERDWVIEFLKSNGDMVDIVSVHKYPFPNSMASGSATIEELRQNTQEWDLLIMDLREQILEHTGRQIPFAITEVNSHYTKAIEGEATPDSFFNALWWGDVLGRLIRQDIYIVNHWLLTSGGNQGGWGIIGRFEIRPSYYVYTMYQKLGSERVYASSDDSFVTITGSLMEDGTLTLMVINLTDESVKKPLLIPGWEGSTMEHWLFDETHNAENMGTQQVSETVEFAPRSMNLLVLTP